MDKRKNKENPTNPEKRLNGQEKLPRMLVVQLQATLSLPPPTTLATDDGREIACRKGGGQGRGRVVSTHRNQRKRPYVD
jgi:hypothetical protein